jgi:molybdate transport system regulatory protein
MINCMTILTESISLEPVKARRGMVERRNKGTGMVDRGSQSAPTPENTRHTRIFASTAAGKALDPVQLNRLEQAFRAWTERSARSDVRLSRQRILLIFLLIRYTGAKLSEVLALDPFRDIDTHKHVVIFGQPDATSDRAPREVQIPAALSQEIQTALADVAFQASLDNLFNVDPAHVRRKFYERTVACGFPKESGGPDAIRKARAVELLQNNVPLPVVQKIL